MLAQSKQAQELEATIIQRFNELLSTRMAQFSTSHEGVKTVVVDTQAPFHTAINDPKKYGSKDATCYNSDGKSCLWYNDYHPGMVSSGSLVLACRR
jgi:phospholipase/lecithinase/hemolysin